MPKRYTEEFKQTILDLYEQGQTPRQLASDHEDCATFSLQREIIFPNRLSIFIRVFSNVSISLWSSSTNCLRLREVSDFASSKIALLAFMVLFICVL